MAQVLTLCIRRSFTAMSSLTTSFFLQESRQPSLTKLETTVETKDPEGDVNIENSSLLYLVLSLDAHFTHLLAICAHPQTTARKYLRHLCYLLEISGHGILWFALCGILGLIYLITKQDAYWTYTLNIFSILIADVILIAPIKLYFQRPRPTINNGKIPLSVSSVDKYAFPSGHTSRCVALAAYFYCLAPFNIKTQAWGVWALSVSLSRILIGRHHISDVLAGILAGLIVFETIHQSCLVLL